MRGSKENLNQNNKNLNIGFQTYENSKINNNNNMKQSYQDDNHNYDNLKKYSNNLTSTNFHKRSGHHCMACDLKTKYINNKKIYMIV